MTDIWTTFVNGVQGLHTRPVNIQGLQSQCYDMGRPVGSFRKSAAELEELEEDLDEQAEQPAADTRVTKASQVRALLRAAKAAGCQDLTQQVEPVMQAMGMSRSQATSYVKAHWHRV
jgi:Sec-independent protein translocase protein TatA